MKRRILKQLFVMPFLLATLLSIFVYAQTTDQIPQIEFGSAQIVINDVSLNVEYAHNFEQRARGLMYRNDLCDNCGMLFEFDYARMAGFWMKNTLIPLDIAYIDSEGIIADIKPMYPLVMKSVPSSRKVLYALEMNQGWFSEQGISAGDRMQVIGRSKAE